MDADKIRNIAEEELAEGSLFLVEVNITPGNEIEVVIDSDGSVDIDDCVALSRAIEERLDREEEDFELTVTSAGIADRSGCCASTGNSSAVLWKSCCSTGRKSSRNCAMPTRVPSRWPIGRCGP